MPLQYNLLMPSLTFRLSDVEREELDRLARAEGVSVAVVVRRALGFAQSGEALEERVAGIESRVERLEQMAGL